MNTIKHTDAREIGAEWVCLQAIRELEIDKFLRNEGWSEIQINTTLAHLITRTIYSPSELKSMRIMDENSAVCELVSGNQEWRPGFQSIYKVAPSLYELKDRLESHLCQKTDDLFNITNRIAIFDLMNFYFEGRKDNSKKAQFGRSKEKRSDCKLLVLVLCINREGFIRYSSILAGNTIRYKLKQTGETCFWTEIVRRLSTQKAVTTEAKNALGEKVHMRLCSAPNKAADDIYERLKYKKMPFRKNKLKKVCSTQHRK